MGDVLVMSHVWTDARERLDQWAAWLGVAIDWSKIDLLERAARIGDHECAGPVRRFVYTDGKVAHHRQCVICLRRFGAQVRDSAPAAFEGPVEGVRIHRDLYEARREVYSLVLRETLYPLVQAAERMARTVDPEAAGDALQAVHALGAEFRRLDPVLRQLLVEAWRVLYYQRYLKSAGWRARRAKVLDRCHGRCEGCADRPAEQVHHQTYERVGDELLTDLVALCRPCHERKAHRVTA